MINNEFDEDSFWEITEKEQDELIKKQLQTSSEKYEKYKQEEKKESQKESQKQQDIKKNVCEIDFEFALDKQTYLQKSVMSDYIRDGMDFNAAIRGEGGRPINRELMKRLDENFAPIKIDKKCSSSAYYIVYRCISKELKDMDRVSKSYMSTSNRTFGGRFGSYCFRIFVPIETPVLLGDISETTSIPNTYEIVFPIGTTLNHIEGSETYEYRNGDFYIERKGAIGGSGVKRKRKRSIKKKTIRIKRSVKLNNNSKKIIKMKGKREKINRSKKSRR
jgi:hypothetical protein